MPCIDYLQYCLILQKYKTRYHCQFTSSPYAKLPR